jgi:hypothetical protein
MVSRLRLVISISNRKPGLLSGIRLYDNAIGMSPIATIKNKGFCNFLSFAFSNFKGFWISVKNVHIWLLPLDPLNKY